MIKFNIYMVCRFQAKVQCTRADFVHKQLKLFNVPTPRSVRSLVVVVVYTDIAEHAFGCTAGVTANLFTKQHI